MGYNDYVNLQTRLQQAKRKKANAEQGLEALKEYVAEINYEIGRIELEIKELVEPKDKEANMKMMGS